jgi:hypothetical protein
MPPWLSYKNYEIQSVTTLLASGQWQVEVRVFFHDGRQVGNWGGPRAGLLCHRGGGFPGREGLWSAMG